MHKRVQEFRILRNRAIGDLMQLWHNNKDPKTNLITLEPLGLSYVLTNNAEVEAISGECIITNHGQKRFEYVDVMNLVDLVEDLDLHFNSGKPERTDSWVTTHFLVTENIFSIERDSCDITKIDDVRSDGGMFAVADLALAITDQFEKKYKDVAWGEDDRYGDYVDVLDEFVKKSVKI
jgi:hypothetical protein